MHSIHRYLTALGVAGVLFAATACASDEASTKPPTDQALQPSSGTNVSATFGSDPKAFNYDKKLVPDGARAQVVADMENNATKVTLTVQGLLPNRPYGAHAHAMACGPNGEMAGAHFQHMPDPTKPSVNPAFANPRNEIWLDFTTDAQGNATVTSTVPWTFSNARAGSVVIHADPTQTAPGKAGTAGARAACVSVPF
jgi:Cu-Zn family superoxide dismutase